MFGRIKKIPYICISNNNKNNNKMKKADLIQKTKERFSNLPQDVAVVVSYKGVKHRMCPQEMDYKYFSERNTIEDIKPFYYGEIVQEEQQLCPRPEYQYLTFRFEAGIDAYSLAYHTQKDFDCLIGITKIEMGNGFSVSNTGVMYAPSHLTLPQIKLLVNEICEENNILDCHILIQSIDYPIFEGLRDRDTPQPDWKSIYEASLA